MTNRNPRAGQRLENTRRALALRGEGVSFKEIAARLGLSAGTVRSYVTDPTGEKDRARRERYRGTCEVCGKRTTGSGGPRKAPRRCVEHRVLPDTKYWTRERLIETIRAWAMTYGEPPSSSDWNDWQATHALHDSERAARARRLKAQRLIPAHTNVYREFGSWGAALEAAGFKPRAKTGSKENMRRRRVKPPKTHCVHGHKMTPENTLVNNRGHRFCRECARANSRRRMARFRRRKKLLLS